MTGIDASMPQVVRQRDQIRRVAARLTDGDLVTIHALAPAIIGVDPIRARLAELNVRLPPCIKPPGPAQ